MFEKCQTLTFDICNWIACKKVTCWYSNAYERKGCKFRLIMIYRQEKYVLHLQKWGIMSTFAAGNEVTAVTTISKALTLGMPTS